MSSTDSIYTDDMIHQMLTNLMSSTSSQHSHHSDLSAPFRPWDSPTSGSGFYDSTPFGSRDGGRDQRLDAPHFSPLWSSNGNRETPSLEQEVSAIRKELNTFRLATVGRFDYLEARMSAGGPRETPCSQDNIRDKQEIARLNSIIKELKAQDSRKGNDKLRRELEESQAEVGRLEMALEFEMEGKRELDALVKAIKESEANAKQDLQKSLNSNFELKKLADSKIESLQKSLDSMSKAKKSLEDGESKIQNSLRQEVLNLKKSLQSESKAKSSLQSKVHALQETLDGVTEIQKSFESEVNSLKKTLEKEQKEHKKVMEEKEKEANQKIVSLENRLKEASSTAPSDSQAVSKLQKTVENQSKQYKELQKKSKQDTVTIGKMQKKLDTNNEEIKKLELECLEVRVNWNNAIVKENELIGELTDSLQARLELNEELCKLKEQKGDN